LTASLRLGNNNQLQIILGCAELILGHLPPDHPIQTASLKSRRRPATPPTLRGNCAPRSMRAPHPVAIVSGLRSPPGLARHIASSAVSDGWTHPAQHFRLRMLAPILLNAGNHDFWRNDLSTQTSSRVV
jgi:hypothetical protein